MDNNTKWIICLALVIAGAIIALISGFVFQSAGGVATGIILAIIGVFFKP